MKTLTPWLVLLPLLLAPFAHAQSQAPAEPAPRAEPDLTAPPSPPEAAAPAVASPARAQVTATPPSATSFVGRMTLVTLGSVLGELAGFFGGLYGGAALGSLTLAVNGAIIGGNLVAGLGALGFGAMLSDNNAGGTIGALVGSVVGVVASFLLAPLTPAVFAVPVLCTVVGFGIGFSAWEAKPAATTRRDGGIRISPTFALTPGNGGGHVGLAGSF
jgi:hypothetical protein